MENDCCGIYRFSNVDDFIWNVIALFLLAYRMMAGDCDTRIILVGFIGGYFIQIFRKMCHISWIFYANKVIPDIFIAFVK
jgi:hypothetical protein